MTDPSAPAHDVFALSLERHEHQGLRKLRLLAWSALALVSLGAVDTPSVGEFVLRRRSDGAEVLRMDAESQEETSILQHELESQLRTLTAFAFAERWSFAL
ncbi:hypothetical protein [Aeromicrobium sp. IC_218]|uniref:hypothetical protein n=1 Tax=Aeromicrobium sp. IC_218 TaxID=2545468 RepID=UPI00103F7941|nr:hypothetical protein [Aeromicrobium sp. IC_218]TCI95903.1 hypothetical protein E0W78_15835 [Aeromicrobium sp. IC_218]